jgi:hypothetical protein
LFCFFFLQFIIEFEIAENSSNSFDQNDSFDENSDLYENININNNIVSDDKNMSLTVSVEVNKMR